VVLEASILEIDIDELRVAPSRLADVEFRLSIVLANCECFPKGYLWPYRVHPLYEVCE